MTMRDPARMYRESAVRGASPIGLIVILYDEIVRSLRKAVRAFDTGDIEARCKQLTHAVEVIGYLQSILDFERGGDIARNLSNFYNLMRRQFLEIQIKPTHSGLELLADQFAKLAAAWQQAERSLSQPVESKSAANADLHTDTSRATEIETSLVAMER
jgi:flagellar secretion chaperone FliS